MQNTSTVVKTLIAFCSFFFVQVYSYAQCNTAIVLCEPTINAGPFNFVGGQNLPDGCLLNFGNNLNYGFVVANIAQGGDLNLLVEANTTGGTGFIDVAIYNITGMSDPCNEMQASDNLACYLPGNVNSCVQFGNNFTCSESMTAPVVQTGDVILIIVEDVLDNHTDYSLTFGTSTGSALVGAPNASIENIGDLCSDAAPVQLSANGAVGIWSGNGVDANGMFNPSLVSVGEVNVSFQAGFSSCTASDNLMINVIDCTNGGGSNGGAGVCNISSVTAEVVNCDPDNLTIDVTGEITFVNPPDNGQMIVIDGKGNMLTYNAPFISPFVYTFENLAADGSEGNTVSVTFSENVACSGTSNAINYPANCNCNVSAGYDEKICLGDSVLLNAEGSVNYTWSVNVENGNYYLPSVGLSTLTVTANDGAGCESVDSKTIEVIAPPKVNFKPSLSLFNVEETEVEFENLTTGASTYLWSFGNGTSTSQDTNPIYTFYPFQSRSYSVQLIAFNQDGCKDSIVKIIEAKEQFIYYIPNSFSPDGNAYNHYFTPVMTSGYDKYDFNMKIYNRWGELLFETNDDTKGWDGSYDNKECAQGTYIWTIETGASDSDERYSLKGTVNLLR